MDGDIVKGVLPMGQITGIIHDTPTVQEVIERIVKEAKQAYRQIGSKL
jgi:NAD(P)H-dependent flavin oxidoreductase YrpB (nitropropane dioxygenase family)